MKENPIQEKSYKFAIRIVGLYQYLVKEKKRICFIQTGFKKRGFNVMKF